MPPRLLTTHFTSRTQPPLFFRSHPCAVRGDPFRHQQPVSGRLGVPRSTYGLPFCDLTDAQYQKLNAFMLRPLLSALHLPHSVLRAGGAYVLDLPVLET